MVPQTSLTAPDLTTLKKGSGEAQYMAPPECEWL